MDSTCVRAKGLESTVVLLKISSAFPIYYLDSYAYVIDGENWPNIEEVRRSLEPLPRKFDEPFSLGIPPLGFDDLILKLDSLLLPLFGSELEVIEKRQSWRPRPSGPEPIHFDSWHVPGLRAITAYLNVASSPREYGISRTFSELLRTQGKDFKEQAEKNRAHLSVVLREQARQGLGPLSTKKAPRHFLSLAPGSVLVFDPRQISHELRWGEGAICRSWLVR